MTSYRRIVLGLAVIGALVTSPVAADINGTRRMERATHRCQQVARHLSRHGLTAREYAYLIRVDCKQQPDGSWTTALFFTEDEP